MIIIAAIIIISIVLTIKSVNYNKTEYASQTGTNYWQTLYNKGKYGEYLTWKNLKNISGCSRFVFNCYIPKDNGETTEIDVVLIHDTGIYVLESKNYSGWIFGSETQQYWTQTLPSGRGRSHKEKFFNPIIQNKVHLKWLEKYLDIDSENFYSYIVFSERCTLKNINLTSGQHCVINRQNLNAAISNMISMRETVFTPEEIDEIYNRLAPLTLVTEAEKLAHIQIVREKQNGAVTPPPKKDVEVLSEKYPERFCPKCGSPLVLKRARKGQNAGNKFLGCSNYPKCRYIRNLSAEEVKE